MRRIIYRQPTEQDWATALENEKLLNRYVRYIRAHIDREMFSFDELKSYGWEGLLQAIQSHDPEKGTLATHAWFCVRSAVSLGIRQELAQRGRALKRGRRLESSEMPLVLDIDEVEIVEEFPDDEVGEYADIQRALWGMDPEERQVLLMHYYGTREFPEGMSTREIGKALGCSGPWAHAMIRRALRSMRTALGTEEDGAA